MHDPIFATAGQLAAVIRQRRISAVEAMDADLAQIARHNPALNAIITLDEEGARKQAKAADAGLAQRQEAGPLHGVPMTLKNGHATAGMRTTVGSSRRPRRSRSLARSAECTDGFIAAWERFFGAWDLLLCPALMCTAFPHCETGAPIRVDAEEVPHWTALGHGCPFNLTGHPAAVIPIATASDGLPIGAQIVAGRWNDMRLLAIARTLAGMTEGFRRPPGL